MTAVMKFIDNWLGFLPVLIVFILIGRAIWKDYQEISHRANPGEEAPRDDNHSSVQSR